MKKYIHVPTISVLTMGERKYTIKIEKRKNSCTRLELEVISYTHTHTYTHTELGPIKWEGLEKMVANSNEHTCFLSSYFSSLTMALWWNWRIHA